MDEFSKFEPSPPHCAASTSIWKLICSRAITEFLAPDGGWTAVVEKAAVFASHEHPRTDLSHLSEYRTTGFDYNLPLT